MILGETGLRGWNRGEPDVESALTTQETKRVRNAWSYRLSSICRRELPG
jgi:hypothetical protein